MKRQEKKKRRGEGERGGRGDGEIGRGKSKIIYAEVGLIMQIITFKA
jgi:hypothetical protein